MLAKILQESKYFKTLTALNYIYIYRERETERQRERESERKRAREYHPLNNIFFQADQTGKKLKNGQYFTHETYDVKHPFRS